MSSPLPPNTDTQLVARLEALLFVAPGAVAPAQLAAALEIPENQIEAGLAEMEKYYAGRHIRLQRHSGRVQLTTAPEIAPLVEKFLGLESDSPLSRAALEALSIIVYRQPVTRPQIDAIRGVNSDGVLKSLLNKGLIQEMGRAEGPGRPILYSVTNDFLQHFGLNSVAEMPTLEKDSNPGQP
jgi:segregation and condensation protein B